MIKIYHNPRCSKSREGISVLEEINQPYEIIKYLENPITKEELMDILKKLNYKPLELVRTKEAIWIENFKGKNLSDDEIIEAMVQNPKLIERPIIINGDKAVVARPKEKIKEIL
ncbi:arsenate reductase (glutaredoxin) [uncultured Flavobacterium sp.]|uniref:arsenate reductase (glutaredoxin) n=1 Tax=uncultured Flavobacterium sp. TaxID=165435 RepID=UPI0030C8137B